MCAPAWSSGGGSFAGVGFLGEDDIPVEREGDSRWAQELMGNEF